MWGEKNDLDKALADYTEAIRIDPNNASAYSGRAKVWNAKGEFDKAIDDYNEASRLEDRLASVDQPHQRDRPVTDCLICAKARHRPPCRSAPISKLLSGEHPGRAVQSGWRRYWPQRGDKMHPGRKAGYSNGSARCSGPEQPQG